MATPAAAPSTTPPNGAGGTPPAEIQQALNWEAENTGKAAKPAETPAAKPPEGKPAEGKPAETPAAVELKWHEEVRVTEEGRGKFAELLKEHGLKPEQGQKYLDLVRDLQAEGDKQALAELDKREAAEKAERVKALREHPEFGGAKFDESFAIARKAAAQFGGKELLQLFKSDSRYGDNPVLFGLLVKVGRALGEDAIGGDKPAGTAPQTLEQKLISQLFTGPEAPKEGK